MNKLTPYIQKFKDDDQFAGVFGVIMFTKEHAHVRSVLENEIKWDALDEVSGDKFAIFSSRMQKGKYQISGGGPRGMGMLIQTWEEPNENKELLNLFELDNTKDLPVICFFAEVRGNIQTCSISIDNKNEDAAFDSLMNAIRDVTAALNFMPKANIHEGRCAFRVVDIAADNHKAWRVIKKGFKFIPGIGRIIV